MGEERRRGVRLGGARQRLTEVGETRLEREVRQGMHIFFGLFSTTLEFPMSQEYLFKNQVDLLPLMQLNYLHICHPSFHL